MLPIKDVPLLQCFTSLTELPVNVFSLTMLPMKPLPFRECFTSFSNSASHTGFPSDIAFHEGTHSLTVIPINRFPLKQCSSEGPPFTNSASIEDLPLSMLPMKVLPWLARQYCVLFTKTLILRQITRPTANMINFCHFAGSCAIENN